ncbi:MAG TPA: hypothetical protein VKU41_10840 [Polyangiaceae bacterium]|nr:hypothetical protein [Polyangiaceae bacterium]
MLRFLWPLAGAAIGAGAIAGCAGNSSADAFASPGGAAGTVPGSGSSNGGSSGNLGGGSGSSSGASTVPNDAAPGDAGPAPTTVTFVHASPGLFDKRLCWSVGGHLTTVPPFPSGTPMPASNYPGIPAGGAAMLADASELTAGPVTFYAIDANLLAGYERVDGVHSCVERLQPNGTHAILIQASQTLPVVPAVPRGSASVLALEGCVAGVGGASASTCGPTWDPVQGNLHMEAIDVASLPTAAAGVLKLQAALLSPGLAALLGDGGPLYVGFGPKDGGGGTFASLAGEGDVQPAGGPALVTLGTDPTSFAQLGLGLNLQPTPPTTDASAAADGSIDAAAGATPGDGAADGTAEGGPADGGALAPSAPLLWMSLLEAQSLVDPGGDPRSYFGASATYVAAIVGDPGEPTFGASSGGAYDGRGLHVLVLPSRPQ